MIKEIPYYVDGVFVSIVVAVLFFIVYCIQHAIPKSKKSALFVFGILILWIAILSILALTDYFLDFSLPPKMLLFVAFAFVVIFILLGFTTWREVLNNIPITTLHYIHIVRVPIEMVLWWMAIGKSIPMDFTFEGTNFDIVSGISAPFAAVFLVDGKKRRRLWAIIWNVSALGLLACITLKSATRLPYFTAVLEGPDSFAGLFQFPYILLPTFVLPTIAFAHLVSLNQLIFVSRRRQLQF